MRALDGGRNLGSALSLCWGACFIWMRVIIIKEFSTFPGYTFHGPLARERRLFIGLFLSVSPDISGLPTSGQVDWLAASLK